jgi:release factor glutamine methyltransferase
MSPVTSILTHLEQVLQPISGSTSLHEAETILQFVLNCTRSDLYSSPAFSEIPDEMLLSVEAIIAKRLVDEPLPYILGSVYFFSKEILLTRDVLIPRPETEVLVETVLKREQSEELRFADIGTGSGAIAAVLLKERPQWYGLATDISLKALAIARRNVPGHISFACVDMIGAFRPGSERFDFMVSNPPYVSEAEMAQLDNSVIQFEPHSALYGGVDGMDFYRILAADAGNVLKPGGRIYCEIGCDQGAAVGDIFEFQGWSSVEVRNDLAGRPRVVAACHSSEESNPF